MDKIKCLIVILLLFTLSGAVSAQSGIPVKHFEFEVKVGYLTYPFENVLGQRKLDTSLGVEARWNFSKIPVDLGLEYNSCSLMWKNEGDDYRNQLSTLSIFSDYSFWRGRTVSPFLGVGLGYASCDVRDGWYHEGNRLTFAPRVGVELVRHFRLTIDARLAMKGYNAFEMTAGYVFGGGKKR